MQGEIKKLIQERAKNQKGKNKDILKKHLQVLIITMDGLLKRCISFRNIFIFFLPFASLNVRQKNKSCGCEKRKKSNHIRCLISFERNGWKMQFSIVPKYLYDHPV
jgi:hypothetical protein